MKRNIFIFAGKKDDKLERLKISVVWDNGDNRESVKGWKMEG